MKERDDLFYVMPLGEMRKAYYLPGEAPAAISLDASRVPAAVHPLIPLAEQWGISDDVLRAEACQKAQPGELEQLRALVEQYADELDEWLAGNEADSKTPSAEYLAFSNMRMAADGC